MQINPVLPLWIIIAIGIALMFLFGWLEWKRNTKFLLLRLIAVVVMILSVMLYVMQPGLVRERNTGGAIILTQNYLDTQVDSMLAKYPDYNVLIMPEATAYRNGQKLNSNNDVLSYKNQIRMVLGDGLPEWTLPDSGFQFVSGTEPKGIIKFNVPSKIYANRKTNLRGVWNGEATWLILDGPSGKVDSVSVEAGTNRFSLSFTPQQAGKFLYSLRASSTKVEEVLPIEVLPVRELEILILQSYPSAETRYLKNFLIEQGHRVAVRTQVSKTNFRTEFGNRNSLNLNRITSELLNEFDLVVLANETTFTKSEQLTIDKAIRSGLGLVWLCTNEEMQKPLFGFEATPYAEDTARVQLNNKQVVFPAVATQIKSKFIPVVANANRALSGYKTLGTGKVGFQLLQETYTLLVNEQSEGYGSLWSLLLETLARPASTSTKIKIKNKFPVYPNCPVDIEVISVEAQPTIAFDSVLLPLREDVVIDNYWSTTGWTTQSGWHSITSALDSTTVNFYVSKPGAWQGLTSASLQTLNQANQSVEKIDGKKVVIELSRISPLWFFIFFLLSAGFLWLVPKL